MAKFFPSTGSTAVPLFTSSTLPTADASWAGRLVRLKDTDVDEQLLICRQLADNSYQWLIVAY